MDLPRDVSRSPSPSFDQGDGGGGLEVSFDSSTPYENTPALPFFIDLPETDDPTSFICLRSPALEPPSVCRSQSLPMSRDRRASEMGEVETDERTQTEGRLRRVISLGSSRYTFRDDPSSSTDGYLTTERRYPSGPSSPSSTTRFVPAPGRVFSGFSDEDALSEGHSLKPPSSSPSFAKLDVSPTLPAYCPSPALTPSPGPSFDSPELSTPFERPYVRLPFNQLPLLSSPPYQGVTHARESIHASPNQRDPMSSNAGPSDWFEDQPPLDPSSRTTSSTGRSVPITPSNSTSPPQSFTALGTVKRHSKTLSSGSSTSSDSSTRGHPSHWLERPDISTVFEEENSVDVEAEDREDQRRRKIAQGPLPRTPADYPISLSRTSSQRSKPHPFASTRSPSPSLPISQSLNTSLSRRADRNSILANSRSQPNLAESFRMPTPILVPAHQVNLVSSEDKNDDELCPVCVESLSFTFRLPGEKPHIVPECGHALHEECFVTVYGDVPPEGSKRNLGVCGVCRQPMRIVDGGERKGRGGNKLAALMGQGGSSKSTYSPSIRSTPGRTPISPPAHDPLGDDPLESVVGMSASNSSRSLSTDAAPVKVIVPSIIIRSEHPSVVRSQNRRGKQILTAMVTVQVPSAGDRGRYPPRPRPPEYDDQPSPPLPPSPRSASSHDVMLGDPFAHVVADLKNRVVDYKSSGLDSLGPLRLFDLLCVRKGSLIREFHVYLFQEALICISEEKKTGFRSMFSSSSSVRSNDSGTSASGRGVLKLKGRIYIRHVRKVVDSSVQGELSLTIAMVDDSMDSFILTFKDRGSHETWRLNLARLIEEAKGPRQAGPSSSKIAKVMGSGAPPMPLPRSAVTPSSASSALGMAFDLTSPASGYVATPATSAFSTTSTPITPADLAYVQPIAPVHTPLDLVIILSLPAPSSTSIPLKVRLMRSSLAFVLALLGTHDRVSLVACEMGFNGTVRRTPFLSTTRYESRKRLEAFVETIGTGRVVNDEYEVQVGQEEKQDVVTAVNVALDVVLQRRAKNPLTGMILISDTSDGIKRAQMDLVTARLDAANTPVHAIGYGKSHDPSPLWMISNHTNGTYTFVKEWYDLRDSLAGLVGGLMSIAVANMKLHLSCRENDFRVIKVSGTSQAIVSINGKDVDIELRELRHSEVREMLVELEVESGGDSPQRYSRAGSGSSDQSHRNSSQPDSLNKSPSFTVEQSLRGLGLDTLSVTDANALRDVVYEDALIDEVPVTEVDCSFHDPAAGRSVARLAHPVLLTVALLPSHSPPSSIPSDPSIVRRRMELLASDMITRALLIASRKNFAHAARLLKETRRIIETIADNLRQSLPSYGARSKREVQVQVALEGLSGTMHDVDMLLDGLEEHKESFERDHRNYSAQQAVVLCAQKSWTTRTASERRYCTKEVQDMIQLSGERSARP